MSKIEVNTITQQCGPSLTVGGGACKSVTLDATTVTLGRCGATVSLAAGATQSGFGRTGTVDWCTTAKTAPFTGVSGKGYFVNTTCGAVTVTLPATPTAGDIISIADYASTFQTNNVTVCNNGSKINGTCAVGLLTTKGQSITLIYVDATRGWKNTMDSTSNVTGTIIYNVEYLVVAGGGGGASGTQTGEYGGGGGGAGGFRNAGCFSVNDVQPYPITVGGGGTGGAPCFSGTPLAGNNKGSPSIFSAITSAAGGGGGGATIVTDSTQTGGSGGGAGGGNPSPGHAGNTPPVSPPQGNPGGDGFITGGNVISGGGGGAGGAGQGYPLPPNSGGNGGVGSPTAMLGSSPAAPLYGTPGPNPGKYFAGGGAGRGGYSGNAGTAGCGGAGGGGGTPAATSGTVNTGGGGGADRLGTGGGGGSGIVVLKYTTACASPTVSGGTAYTCGSYTIRVFTSDGTFTA